MRYQITINQKFCIDNKLTPAQGAMVDIFNQLSSWAEFKIIDDKVFYFISRTKILTELPLYFSKPDTIYRNLKVLNELNIIDYRKVYLCDYVRLKPLGKRWNQSGFKSEFVPDSDSNPSASGFESESVEIKKSVSIDLPGKYSDANPTYNNIITTIEDKGDLLLINLVKKEYANIWQFLVLDELFSYRILKSLESEKMKTTIPEVLKIIIKWLTINYTAGNLDKSNSICRNSCVSYVQAVIKSGGWNEIKKKSVPRYPEPASTTSHLYKKIF
tara:strand:+ start:8337 stop:9152 length:816 start_codon:yes stop_codon:yes gene_type:complete